MDDCFLALDVGNTRTAWAIFAADGSLLAADRSPRATALAAILAGVAGGPTSELPAGMDAPDASGNRAGRPVPSPAIVRTAPGARLRITRAAASSVNPAAAEAVIGPLADGLGMAVPLVHRDLPFPLAHRLGNPARTGADRLAAGLGAAELVGAPAVVVDAGTAVTVDVLSSETGAGAGCCAGGAPVFLGGAILPGLATQLWSLHARTAALPEVPLTEPPATGIGDSTEPAIRGGVYFGLVGAIDRLVEDARIRIAPAGTRPQDVPVLLTGGDAGLLSPSLRTAHRVEPWLVLRGVRAWSEAASNWPPRR